jgi:phospholipid/cholesterol/gamma-HCH transport system ATP-binding protein
VEALGGSAEGGDIIAVENLTVGYDETNVLEGMDLRVRAREILTILGPSGCGKTTLLRVLAGLLPARSGTVRIAGQELGEGGALSWVHQHIGVLFQSGALLGSYTVSENVALPLREFTDLPAELIEEMVQLKLDLVKLGRHGRDMPAQLSGGMRKRAALARAMALDPQVLLCDEPSSGLDPATAVEIDKLLVELNQAMGVTVVLVTHELASIENISRRCVMLDGEAKGIIAEGTFREIRKANDNPRVQAFFQRRIEREGPGEGEP